MPLIDLLKENDWYKSEETDHPGTDKEFNHRYISMFYETHMPAYRKKTINILEIGAATGSSLRLWRDYFPLATVYGVELRPLLDKSLRGEPRINATMQDGYTESFANSLPDMDIVIDDGPHTLESQLKTIELFMPKLRPGGMMVIEDVQSNHDLWILAEALSAFRWAIHSNNAVTGKTDSVILAAWR